MRQVWPGYPFFFHHFIEESMLNAYIGDWKRKKLNKKKIYHKSDKRREKKERSEKKSIYVKAINNSFWGAKCYIYEWNTKSSHPHLPVDWSINLKWISGNNSQKKNIHRFECYLDCFLFCCMRASKSIVFTLIFRPTSLWKTHLHIRTHARARARTHQQIWERKRKCGRVLFS